MSKLLQIFLAAVLLTGCGPAVNPDEINGPVCQSDLCWDLSKVSTLNVNDFPVPGSLVPTQSGSGVADPYNGGSHVYGPSQGQLRVCPYLCLFKEVTGP
jgi:hypothetical protein